MNECYCLGREFKLVKMSLLNIYHKLSLDIHLSLVEKKKTQKYDIALRNQDCTKDHFVTK